MATCLLGLGSNVGDREATLRAAMEAIHALPNAHLLRHSAWHRYRPLGGPPGQGEFLNGAAVIETTIPPLALLESVCRLEERRGRRPAERWAARTLDIDLLLYGREVIETAALTVPHPRMSFRRFVLEPAAAVAPKLIHPIIGWPVERLRLHLDAASDLVAIVSPSVALRRELADSLVAQFNGQLVEGPTFAMANEHWPAALSTWVKWRRPQESGAQVAGAGGGLPYAAAAFPKLTILLDADLAGLPGAKARWSAIVRQPGRGPMLRIATADPAAIQVEVFAAIESVWPDLGPSGANRLE